MTTTRPDDADRELGLDTDITRRDFLNSTLLGAGAMLLGAPAPSELSRRLAQQPRTRPADPWTGYAGVGDYALANGNTRPVLDAAHRIRDGAYAKVPDAVVDIDEPYDLVVVGGGIAGLTAAYAFAKASGGAKRCLVLENH